MTWLNRINGKDASVCGSPLLPGVWFDQERSGYLVDCARTAIESEEPKWNLSETLQESLENLGEILAQKSGKGLEIWERIAPLDPMIGDDLDLLQQEQALIHSTPHLEALAYAPRGHLKVEESREPVSRARRISNRSVAVLSSHSEDWQSRTLLGVRPKRVLTETLSDQWDTYENRAVATLHRRIIGRLHQRISVLRQTLAVLEEADTDSIVGSRFRRDRLFRILGEMFTNIPGRERLEATIHSLERARARLLSLSNAFLFRNLQVFQTVESPLQATNIFQSDPHYRRAFHLWHEWERLDVERELTIEEADARIQRAFEHMNRFVRLLCVRACCQLGLVTAMTRATKMDQKFIAELTRDLGIRSAEAGCLELTQGKRTRLRIVPLCLDWSKLQETDWLELLDFADREFGPDRPVLLVGLVSDRMTDVSARWGQRAKESYQWKRLGSLIGDGWGIAEVSPVHIESTEAIARAIRWILAELEWPSEPVAGEIHRWQDAWPELASQNGVAGEGDKLRILSEPAVAVLRTARDKKDKLRLRLGELESRREDLKRSEKSQRESRIKKGEINRLKSKTRDELATTETESEVLVQITDLLARAERSFQAMKKCPCCPAESSAKIHAGHTTVCDGCGARWGWKTCPECRRLYTVVRVKVDSPDEEDLLRYFGADLCSPVISLHPNGWEVACPYCRNQAVGDAGG